MLDISTIILTFNEEIHIERCIKNASAFSKKIYVVDSYSTDKTVQIAEALGATVLQNTFINQSVQFQWALDNCPIDTDWVMRLDADEYMLPALQAEIIEKFPKLPPEITGLCLKRRHHFLGSWIRRGDRYPVTLLRIWKLGHAHIENRWMDEHIVLDIGKSMILDNDFVDDNLNNVSWFIAKHNAYATREMVEIINQKYALFGNKAAVMAAENGQAKLKRLIKEKLYNRLPIFFRPILYFIYRYFIRLGILDGVEGFAYHFMQGLWYRCLVDLKCLEAERVISGAENNAEIVARLEKLTGLKFSN